MKTCLHQMWTEDEGVLSFEWVLIITVIVIGVVGGLAAARDGITDELGDAAEAMLALDQSYRVDFPLLVGVNCETDDSDIESQSSDSAFRDEANFEDCERLEFGFGQGLENDGISGDP